MLLLVLMLACGDPAPPAPPADGPSPAEAVQAVRLELHEAHQAWSEGRASEAQARVHSAYARWFEPLEPALRAREPDRTLALEYAYGRLGARMGRSGDALAIAQQVQGVTREMDELVATLPATAAAPGPVVHGPTSEDATLPSHLVSDPE
jgi:hypothetical protein